MVGDLHDGFSGRSAVNEKAISRLTRRDARIRTIEAARGFAALSVTLFHADTIVSSNGGAPFMAGIVPFTLGERGVDFFFVLSGYIMVHAHRSDPAGWRSLLLFLGKRGVRIYPLVWLLAALVFSINFFIDGEMPSTEKLTTSFLLQPSLVWPSPAVSWTLRHELIFYMVFATSMLNRKFGLLAASAWFAACAAQGVALQLGSGVSGVGGMILSPLNIDFLFGALAGSLAAKLPPRRWIAFTMGGAAGVVLLATSASFLAFDAPARKVLDYWAADGVLWDGLFGLSFGLLVLALALLDLHLSTPSWMVGLGSVSFALYLAHTPVMGLIGRYVVAPLAPGLFGPLPAYLALVAAAVAVATVLHVWFERPVTRALRAIFLRPRPLSQRLSTDAETT